VIDRRAKIKEQRSKIKSLGLTLIETVIGMAVMAVAFAVLMWVFTNVTPAPLT
jgi:type II secretory pathway pseudopilin PulG